MKFLLTEKEALEVAIKRLEYFQGKLLEYRDKTLKGTLEKGEENYVDYYTMEVGRNELLLSLYVSRTQPSR